MFKANTYVTFPAQPEHQYYVVVDGRAGDSGAFTIHTQCTPIFQIEDCANGLDDDCDGLTDCDDTMNCPPGPDCP